VVDVFMRCIIWVVSGHPAHIWRLMVLMAVRETEYIIKNKASLYKFVQANCTTTFLLFCSYQLACRAKMAEPPRKIQFINILICPMCSPGGDPSFSIRRAEI